MAKQLKEPTTRRLIEGRPSPELLAMYYDLWRDGLEADAMISKLAEIFPALGISAAFVKRHLPAFHAHCRQQMIRDTRQALVNDQQLPSVALTPARRERLLELVGCGATLQKAADILNVPLITITDCWYADDVDLRAEVAVVRDAYDYKVVAATHKRALGYDLDVRETHEINEETEKGYRRGTNVVTKVQHVPGSTTAQTLWLKARLGWSDSPTEASDAEVVEFDVRRRMYIEDGAA
jgi:hypothetical protein